MSNARKLADNLPINGVANAENILINGNFIISQRGNYSSATAISTSTYYLDRWKTDISGVSATIQNPSVDLPNGVTTKSAKIAASSSGTGYLQLHQWIEPQPYMDNRQITISAYVRSNNANTRIRVEKTGGNVDGSNTHSGGGGWELLEETITLPDNISSFRIGIIMWNGNAISISSGDYIEMAHFKAEFGPRRTPFEDEPYDVTLRKCQRYFYLETPTSTDSSGRLGVCSHSTTVVFDHTLPVQMRIKPSLSLTSASLRIGDTVSQGFTTSSGTVAQNTYSGTQSITYILGGFSGLTTYRTYLHEPDAASPGMVKFDAEL